MNVGQNTKEAICPIKIAAGQTSGSANFTPISGHVIGCVIFYPETMPNPGIVRASIKDISGTPISESQDIRNYRSRNTNYLDGCKPLNIVTDGNQYTVTYTAKAAMTADFEADLIFIFAPVANQNCPR